MTKQIVLPFVLISTQTNVYIFLSLSYSLSYFLFSWKPNKVTERHFEFYSIFFPHSFVVFRECHCIGFGRAISSLFLALEKYSNAVINVLRFI